MEYNSRDLDIAAQYYGTKLQIVLIVYLDSRVKQKDPERERNEKSSQNTKEDC